MKKALKLPHFKSEDQEREFWSKIDLSDYLEPSDFKPVSFPNLKPTSTPISIRLSNTLNIPYQSLIKQFIAKGLNL